MHTQYPSVGFRRAHTMRAGVASALCALLAVAGLTVGAAAPAIADPPMGGSLIASETFANASLDDPSAWTKQGSACLTGAPMQPAGSSTIGGCPTGFAKVPTPGVVPGYLQLTNAEGNQTGSILYNKPIPASAGVSMTFEQYQYGGNGADGIGFFLVDGSTQLTATGSAGGSLGYAQRGDPGITGGYLGVGLDSFGNFWDDGEGRGNGCPVDQRSPTTSSGPIAPNVISLRGPGSGRVGYCLIGPTVGGPGSPAGATTPYPVTNPTKPGTTLNGGLGTLRATTLAASKRVVNVQVTPVPNPRVIVQVKYTDAGPWVTELNAAAPPNTPSTYKFGFSASTGGSNDVHLVRATIVRTINPLPALQLEKQVDRRAAPLPAVITAGTVIPYQYTVTNVGDQAADVRASVENLTITDDRIAGGAITCQSSTLAPAPDPGSTTVCYGSYTVTAADVLAGRVVNTASAAANVGSPTGPQVVSPPRSVTVPLASSLTIGKQVTTPAPYAVGQNVAYRYTLTNTGGSVLNNFSVTDDRIPSASIICQTGTLNPGEATTCAGSHVIVPGQVNASGYLVNAASASATTGIGQLVPSNRVTASVPVGTDVGVAKTVDNANPVVGSNVTFTVTATNNGPSPATGVVISDQLPNGPAGGVSYVSSSTTGGAYDGGTGAWTIPSIAVGQSFTLTVVGAVNTGSPFTNSATRTRTDQIDINPTNDTASVTLNPVTPTADLVVSKSVDQSVIPIGASATFTVSVQNTGPFDASGVAVADKIPSALGFVSTSGDGSYDQQTGIWTVGALPSGATATRTFVVTGLILGSFTNLAATTGTATPSDPNPSNNSASAVLTVRAPVADLSIIKTPFPQAAVVGNQITYQLSASNLGPDAAPNVSVSDVFPGGVAITTSSATQGTITADGTGWTIGTLASGQTVSATVTATLTNSGTQVNTATITSPTVIDLFPDNNSSSATVTSAQPTLDIGVTKSVQVLRSDTPVTEVPVGTTVEFTLTATNYPDPRSSATATNLRFADNLPAGFRFDSAIPGGAGAGAAYTPGTADPATGVRTGGSWTLTSLAANGTATLTIRATLITAGNWTNTVSLSSLTQTDRDPTNNSASVTVVGVLRADLQIVKSVDPAIGQPGQDVAYSVVVTNNGPNEAVGVEAVDTNLIPANLAEFTVPPGTTFDPVTRVWLIPTLASGASLTLTVTVELDQRIGAFRNVVVVNSSTPDPNTENNTSYADLYVPAADIAVTKSVDKPAVYVGDTVVFSLTVSNLGPDAAQAVSVNDLLPAQFTFVDASPSVGTYDPASGVWSVGDLDPASPTDPEGGVEQLQITAVANAPGPATNESSDPPGTVINAATSDRTGLFPFDPHPENNAAQAKVRIDPLPAQLTLSKTVSQASVAVGSAVTYTVVIGNLGPAVANEVAVTDDLPAGLRPIAVRGTGCIIAAQAVTCTLGDLAVNASDTIEVDAVVGVAGTVVNTASATTSTPPVTPGVVEASATVTGVPVIVPPRPDNGTDGASGLARSGVDPWIPVGTGSLLVLLGLLLVGRRRRRAA